MSGDSSLAGENLRAHYSWLRRIAADLVGDAADDLVQQTWEAALKAPPDRSRPLRPWLAQVMRNAWRMGVRADLRRARREAQVQVGVAPAERSAEELASRHRRLQQVADALGAVDEPYHQTLLLRYLQDQSVAEIARCSGLAASTVRWRTKVGLDMLRAELDRRNAGDRRAWLRGLVPLIPVPQPLLAPWATGVMVMKTSTKIGLGLAGVALAALLGVVVSTSAPDRHAVASGSQAVAPPSEPPPAGLRSPSEASGGSRLAEWERLRARVRHARKRRLADSPGDAGVETSESGASDPSEPGEVTSLLGGIGQQLIGTLGECMRDLPESNAGSVSLHATVITESGVGAIIDNVEVGEASAVGQAMQECLQQAIYSLDLQAPPENHHEELRFDVDLGEGRISAAVVDGVELIAWVAEHPQLIGEHLDAVEATFAATPALAEQFPAVAQAAREARSRAEAN